MEMFDLIIPTVKGRERALRRCTDSFMTQPGALITPKPFLDPRPQVGNMTRLVALRNLALDHATSEWAFLCDDDDMVLSNHIKTCMILKVVYPDATVIMTSAYTPNDEDPNGNGIWQSTSCSLINVEKFRQVGWMDPTPYGGGGEDFFTHSTIRARGGKVIFDPTVTWQIGQDQVSTTRKRPVLVDNPVIDGPVEKVESYCKNQFPGGCRIRPYCWEQQEECSMGKMHRLLSEMTQLPPAHSRVTSDTLEREKFVST